MFLSPNLRGLGFVYVSILMHAIGFGLIYPVLPDLLRDLTRLSDDKLALHMGGLTFIYASMQFFLMPVFGALSDSFGRRPVLLISMLALAGDFLLLAPSIVFVYLGRMIAGGLGATLSTANAYISDVTQGNERAQRFAMVGAIYGVGFMIGPAIGGVLGDSGSIFGDMSGTRLPFFIAAILSALSFCVGFFVLEESLNKEDRTGFSFKHSSLSTALRSLNLSAYQRSLLSALFVIAMAHTVYATLYALSAQVKFNWSSREIGLGLFIIGLGSIIVQGVLIRIIIPRFGLQRTAMIGLMSGFIAYLMLGLSRTGLSFYAAGIFVAFASLATAAMTNMISLSVDKGGQGKVHGAIGSLQGLALMIGPLLMSFVFYFATKEGARFNEPGAPFILSSFFILTALVAFLYGLALKKRQ